MVEKRGKSTPVMRMICLVEAMMVVVLGCCCLGGEEVNFGEDVLLW